MWLVQSMSICGTFCTPAIFFLYSQIGCWPRDLLFWRMWDWPGRCANQLSKRFSIIITRQNLQLSDLSLDGQNIENVFLFLLVFRDQVGWLGLIVNYKLRWQAQMEHYAKACQKTTTVSSFSTATYHQHRYQKNLLQRSHKTSHRLCLSSVGWLRRSTLEQIEISTSKGRQINPSWSFPIYRAKDECTWNFKPTATARLQ